MVKYWQLLNERNPPLKLPKQHSTLFGIIIFFSSIFSIEEKKISLDWESKCAELQLKLDGTITEYEEKLHARDL